MSVFGEQKDSLAMGIEEKIHGVIRRAVYQVFEHTMCVDKEENTHYMALGRILLELHLGLPQVLQGFQKKILPLKYNKAEKIFNKFYKVLTPEFLADFLISKVQTEEELE